MRTKTLQTNIAVNGPYDTKLCGSNTVWCHTDHLAQCWSNMLCYFAWMFVIIVSLS